MRGISVRKTEDEQSEIDLTPMLDVVFIMLIFFIVTASFVKESGVDATRPPKTDSPPSEESKNIVVSVTASNEIIIDGRRVDKRAVRANIERLAAENPKAMVIISAAEQSEMDPVVAVIDAARAAGVGLSNGVALVTKP